MPLKLRDYQDDLAKRATAALKKSKSVVVQLETGAGKTHIAAKLAKGWVREKKRVWFIAHRQEILAQAQKAFEDAGVKRVEFMMIATAAKAPKREKPDVLIFDECHHSPAKTWAGVIMAAPKALRLGLTATPGRLDGVPLSDFFAELVKGPSPKELRESGHLARYRYFAPVVPDLSGVKVRKGEYDRSQAVNVMTGPTIVGDVVDHYRRHAAGKRAILFAVSVAASQDMAARFNAAGIPALHVDGKTPDDKRAAAISAVRSGKVKVLCNVELFTEGFDLPAIDAVILLRPTRSLAMFRQMLGRGTRPSGRNKTVILDHAACVVDHGLPDEEYEWTLDGEPPRRKVEIECAERTRMRRCPDCTAVHGWADACPECGRKYSNTREVTEIGGQLGEVEKPQGCVSPFQYAKMKSKGHSTIYRWIKAGMPTNAGFVDPPAADAWYANYRKGVNSQRAAVASRMMEDPGRRAKLSAQATAQMNQPEARAAHSKFMQSFMKNLGSDPEVRRIRSVRMESRYTDPAERRALSEKLKAFHAARKAQNIKQT